MWLSVLGMYEYNNSLFDGLAVPDGLEKNDVVNNILFECAELEIIYPNFEIFKTAINIWSASEQITWNKLYNTMTIEYNPIWNVDANESETETNTRDINTNSNGSNNESINMTDTGAVQGFNSSNWADANKNTKQGTDNVSVSNSETVSDDNERVLTKRRTGNIGVTATQDLIKKEREIAEFNMINYITDSFKKRFCLMIY